MMASILLRSTPRRIRIVISSPDIRICSVELELGYLVKFTNAQDDGFQEGIDLGRSPVSGLDILDDEATVCQHGPVP